MNHVIAGYTYDEHKAAVSALLSAGVKRDCADTLYGWAAGWSPAEVARNIAQKAGAR